MGNPYLQSRWMIAEDLCTAEHSQFRETVNRFVEQELLPNRRQWEDLGTVPREVWKKAGDAGLLCCDVPEAYGGAGGDFLHNVIVNEALARAGGAGPGLPGHSDIAVPYITRFGTDEQKQRWLPKAVAGELIICIAVTEPHAGSDVQAIRTRATRVGDEFVIRGQKVYISNAQQAHLAIVAARTRAEAPGSHSISLIVVDMESAGLQRGRMLEKIGRKAQDTLELFFDDVRVPCANLLGAENEGFQMFMTFLIQERLTSAVRSTAAAELAMNQTLEYVTQREAFGKTISEFQNTQFELADLWSMLESHKAFLDRCIGRHLRSRLTAVEAAAVKLRASELEGLIVDRCLQFFGGAGYMWDTPIARAYADARVNRISAGSNHILKLLIGRDLIKRR